MYRKNYSLISSFAALIILSGLLFSACDSGNAVTDESLPDFSTQITETEPADPAAATELPETSETSGSGEARTSVSVITGTSEKGSESISGSEGEPAVLTDTDVGSGSYGFQKGPVRFHSRNDISMMIEPEDATIYDYGARSIPCHWIDIFYMEDSFDMAAFDYSYRFLSFYNDDTSVSFSGYKEIGTWQTPKGSELEIYLAGITIISDNLEIRILPKYPSEPDRYDVSVNGRGYYVSEEQLQMADFILSSLAEDPGTDPLEGIITGVDHTYYF